MEKQIKDREAQIAKNKALNDAFTAGKAAAEQKNWDGAIENFKKASEMEGGNQTVVWQNLGEAYANAAKDKPTDATALRQNAIDAYKKAIELKPDDAGLYNNYALVLGYQKQIPEAQAALEKAAQLGSSGRGPLLLQPGRGAGEYRPERGCVPRVQESHRCRCELCGRIVSIRDLPGVAGQDRRHRQNHGSSRHDRSAPEISSI